MKRKPPLTGIAAAICSIAERDAGGTPSRLARKAGVSRASIYNWQVRGIPLRRLRLMMAVTGLAAAVLRPDYRQAFRTEMGIDPESFLRRERRGRGARKT